MSFENDGKFLIEKVILATWSAGRGMEGLKHLDVAPPAKPSLIDRMLGRRSRSLDDIRAEVIGVSEEVVTDLRAIQMSVVLYLGGQIGAATDEETVASLEAIYESRGNVFPMPVAARCQEAIAAISTSIEVIRAGAYIDHGRMLAEQGAILKATAIQGGDMFLAHNDSPLKVVVSTDGNSVAILPGGVK